MKYAGLTLGTIEAVMNKLGGMEGAQAFLRNEFTLVKNEKEFKSLWKSITIGSGPRSAKEFVSALHDSGYHLGDYTLDILSSPKFKVSEEKKIMELAVLTPLDLGFTKDCSYRDFLEKAWSLGFPSCPIEVGPQLRLQYPDQPEGEWLVIAMDPVRIDDFCGVFVVARNHDDNDMLFLSGDRFDFGAPTFGIRTRFVFYIEDRGL